MIFNRILKGVVFLFFLGGVFYGQDQVFLSVREVIQKMYSVYSKPDTYSVEFVSTKGNVKTRGKIAFRRPDKYRVDYVDNASKTTQIFVNQGLMQIYMKDINVLLEENLKSSKTDNFQKEGLNLFDVGLLLKHYSGEFKGSRLSEDGLYHVYMRPKNKEDLLDEMELWIDKKGLIKRSMTYGEGGTLLFEFFNAKFDEELPSGYFDFEVPPNVERVSNKILGS